MLSWSQNQAGAWNGKAGPYTLMVVACHQGEGWQVHPKLPGLKSVKVKTPEAGRIAAECMWRDWFKALGKDGPQLSGVVK
jgi:hypothetical protein